MNDELESLSDVQLSIQFAVEVAGMTGIQPNRGFPLDCNGRMLPEYATSADAVMPYLEKQHVDALCLRGSWSVSVGPSRCVVAGHSPTFARAACLALIRAHRATKEASP